MVETCGAVVLSRARDCSLSVGNAKGKRGNGLDKKRKKSFCREEEKEELRLLQAWSGVDLLNYR